MFRFVSLGADCQPALHINRHQQQDVPHFFDWIGAPMEGVHRLIETEFEGVLQPGNLHPYCRENIIYAVVDTVFRLDFSHDFTSLDPRSIKTVQDQYRLRARWFMELFDEDSPPTYFVRRSDLRDQDSGDDAALRLLALLQSRRKDVRLLHLHDDPKRPAGFAPGFRSAFLPQPSPFHWKGLDTAWDHVLRRVALTGYAGDGAAFPLPRLNVPNFCRSAA